MTTPKAHDLTELQQKIIRNLAAFRTWSMPLSLLGPKAEETCRELAEFGLMRVDEGPKGTVAVLTEAGKDMAVEVTFKASNEQVLHRLARERGR